MLALLLWVLLAQNTESPTQLYPCAESGFCTMPWLQSGSPQTYVGPWPGIEVSPNDPQMATKINKCVTYLPQGGCMVRFTPGTYYIYSPILLQSGVIEASFKGVRLIPCGDMSYLIGTYTMGPYPGAVVRDLNVPYQDTSKPCGKYVPPLMQLVRPS